MAHEKIEKSWVRNGVHKDITTEHVIKLSDKYRERLVKEIIVFEDVQVFDINSYSNR